MIYFDYSATTPVDNKVLNAFCEASKSFIGNANSLHTLGVKCRNQLSQDSKEILKNLNLDENDFNEICICIFFSKINNIIKIQYKQINH